MTDQIPHRDPSSKPQKLSYPSLQQPQPQDRHESHQGHQGHEGDPEKSAHSGHGLMMIACCIPMLVIVGILVVTGVAGSGLILYALLCTLMMALMMFAMPGGHRH